MRLIDLNADIGEGGDDKPLFQVVSSVNVACGAHAGDHESMVRSVRLSKTRHVHLGAHPSFPDRDNMGRVALDMPLSELRVSVLNQIEDLMRIADNERATVYHCKPHGALYLQACEDTILANMLAELLAERHPELKLVAFAGSRLAEAGREHGLGVVAEGFADRTYEEDGTLRARSKPDALILDPERAAKQALEIASGQHPFVDAVDSLCVHGDTPGALDIATAVRATLEDSGFPIGGCESCA